MAAPEGAPENWPGGIVETKPEKTIQTCSRKVGVSSGPSAKPKWGSKRATAWSVTTAAHKLAHILDAMIKTRPAFDSRKIGNANLIHQPKEGSRRKPAALLGFIPPN